MHVAETAAAAKEAARIERFLQKRAELKAHMRACSEGRCQSIFELCRVGNDLLAELDAIDAQSPEVLGN